MYLFRKFLGGTSTQPETTLYTQCRDIINQSNSNDENKCWHISYLLKKYGIIADFHAHVEGFMLEMLTAINNLETPELLSEKDYIATLRTMADSVLESVRQEDPNKKENIVLHCVAVPAGIGDLEYFARWYKLYVQNFPNDALHRIIIKISDREKLKKFIKNLSARDEKHPLLTVIRLNQEGSDLAYDKNKVAMLDKIPDSYNVQAAFNDLDTSRHTIQQISISYFYNRLYFSDILTSLPNIKIFEFHSELDLPADLYSGCLGVGNNKGLLFDEQLAVEESIDSLISTLPDDLRTQYFPIYNNSAQFFTDNLFVFGYLQNNSDVTNNLAAITTSPVFLDALKQKKTPHIILTGISTDDAIPEELRNLAKAGKIRLIAQPSIDTETYSTLQKIMLHKDCNSIICPSGDNSLTDALQAGKLPIFLATAHPAYKNKPETLLDIAKELATSPKSKGRDDAIKLLTALSKIQHLSVAVEEIEKLKRINENHKGIPKAEQAFAKAQARAEQATRKAIATYLTKDALVFFQEQRDLFREKSFAKVGFPAISNLLSKFIWLGVGEHIKHAGTQLN